MPKFQFSWMGTLIRLATGFWAALRRLSGLSCAAEGMVIAISVGTSRFQYFGRARSGMDSYSFVVELHCVGWYGFDAAGPYRPAWRCTPKSLFGGSSLHLVEHLRKRFLQLEALFDFVTRNKRIFTIFEEA